MASRLRFSVLCPCLPVWAGAADNEPVIELAPVTATRSARTLGNELKLELNKLEDRQDACRAYLVFENRTADSFESLKLDLMVFGSDGVIARHLVLEAAPLRQDKTTVKLFDIAGLACAAIDRILINDVTTCHGTTGPQRDCVARLLPTSRTSVGLVK